MEIGSFFEKYLTQESLFTNKTVLLSSHTPPEIPYREEQLREMANILAPSLRSERPSNLLIYGKTGTGKTLSIKHILASLSSVAVSKNLPLKVVYINCKLKRVSDTEYRLILQLLKEYGREIPTTGLPTDDVYSLFYTLLDSQQHILLLVLDEIDHLVRKIGDNVFYNLTRINGELQHSQICLIGISNNLIFAENLDPRVKSSLSEEEIIFPPYNAIQLQEILQARAAAAFREGATAAGVIEKCAAYAAREHGDARRAIDLLRVAGEVAERTGSLSVTLDHLDEAERKMESDAILSTIINQPKQAQLVLYSILLLSPEKKTIFTGEIYELYSSLCKRCGLNILTQRRISDLLAELDMLGVIAASIVSKGRYGRTRNIQLSLDTQLTLRLKDLLERSLHFT